MSGLLEIPIAKDETHITSADNHMYTGTESLLIWTTKTHFLLWYKGIFPHICHSVTPELLLLARHSPEYQPQDIRTQKWSSPYKYQELQFVWPQLKWKQC